MDLELDDDQTALVDSVRSVLDKEWPAAALRRHVEDGEGVAALWQAMADLDWPALRVPEACDGMGYGPVEAALVIERCGAAATAGPLLATTLFSSAVVALGDAAQQAALLPTVASGAATAGVALTELVASVLHDDAGRCNVTADRAGADWQLRGRLRSVIEGDAVDHVIVPVRLGYGGCAAFVVDSALIEAEAVETTDGSRRLAHLSLDTTVGDDARLANDGLDAFVRLVDEAVVLLAAELVGTCGAILDMVLEHVVEREQFGVKIGSFQALKHRLTDRFVDLEAARASVRYASVALDEGAPDASLAASSAKALASDAAQQLGREGIQMLGGLGFTWEHDMQLYVKRAMASSLLLGTAEDHRQRASRLIGLVPA